MLENLSHRCCLFCFYFHLSCCKERSHYANQRQLEGGLFDWMTSYADIESCGTFYYLVFVKALFSFSNHQPYRLHIKEVFASDRIEAADSDGHVRAKQYSFSLSAVRFGGTEVLPHRTP